MYIIDTALRAREASGNPIRVGLVGSGFMGRAIARQIMRYTTGMRLSAICNRTIGRARRAYEEAGFAEVVEVSSQGALDDAIAGGRPAVTSDPVLLCRAERLDVLLEVTGTIDFGASVVLEAIASGKDVITMNAELDGTVGAILKVRADRAGVILTFSDGDQPGVEMNLFRFVRGMGLQPLVLGNIKGLQDPYRTPTTQEAYARKWGQDPVAVTSYADGTKISFEQAIVANATGMRVAKRGMSGLVFPGHVDELAKTYDADELLRHGGIVDYVVGAKPNPGVFCFGTLDDPAQKHMLNLYKLGEGPLYSFYTPYHLCHLEIPTSIARVVLFRDVILAPAGAPRVEVITSAKTDLRAGQVLDGMGGYLSYGQCENAAAAAAENLLPMGLSEGCRLLRDLPRDAVVTRDDVVLPEGRLGDRLRDEQDAHFGVRRGAGAARTG